MGWTCTQNGENKKYIKYNAYKDASWIAATWKTDKEIGRQY